MKNVLIIGSGGREHALAYKIAQSKLLKQLYIIPGNPGTKQFGKNININPDNQEEILNFCKQNEINLVVIGPEKPLVEGLADTLRQIGLIVFGPNKNAAEIEGYKTFAKGLMKRYKIPTAEYSEFSSEEINKTKKFLIKSNYPLVIKADGLAAGKGVIICKDYDEASDTIDEMFVTRRFGDAGDKIIIEEFLSGEEASIFAITDGKDFICLPSSQDHKRIGDNDTGRNTGGMGAYSPAPIITDEILERIKSDIIFPTLIAMKKENREFNGCLYCGLMITSEGPKVIEYNCRFGDPETQAVLPLLEGDFLELLFSTATGNIDKESVLYSGGASVCVVTASQGYPDSYEKGFEIQGLEEINSKEIIAFHAGTKEENGKIITNGGRVLGITAFAKQNDLSSVKIKVYDALNKINYSNIYFRKDIADKAYKNLQ